MHHFAWYQWFARMHILKKQMEPQKDEESESGLNPFLELPEDVIANILHRLGAYEILKNAQRVCSSWRNICRDPSMWRFVDMKHLGDDDKYLKAMCRQAVDQSHGQLTELHIDRFATDELLHYISERSSKLRCLRIRNCEGVGDDGLIAVAKNCPLLEDLHLLINVHISIQAIGQSCPKLKSFTLTDCKNTYETCNFNFEAFAIAKSMAGLRHLRLVGNYMTNKGLEAILDGCPNLESLDIRRCPYVNMRGEIRDRIAKKIKDFKHPNDVVERCDFEAGVFYGLEDSSKEEDYSVANCICCM